jgi:hypothetical protein
VVTIANEIARDLVRWERLAELLGGPRRRWMVGDGHVYDAATLMAQNDHTNRSRYVAVGTTKKSAAVIWPI